MSSCQTYCYYRFIFYCYGNRRDLRSFPTRRSSDLDAGAFERAFLELALLLERRQAVEDALLEDLLRAREILEKRILDGLPRSEEHTSELQSQFHLVCRLLLEKKKKLNLPAETNYQI